VVDKFSTVWLGFRRGRGVFTCARWQVTLCHPVPVRWSSINSYTRPLSLLLVPSIKGSFLLGQSVFSLLRCRFSFMVTRWYQSTVLLYGPVSTWMSAWLGQLSLFTPGGIVYVTLRGGRGGQTWQDYSLPFGPVST